MPTESCLIKEKKRICRREGLRRRADMGEGARAEASAGICRRLLDDFRYQKAHSLLTYVSYRDEVDTHKLIRTALADGKRVYCPKTDLSAGRMEFIRIRAWEELRPGFRGIPEPVRTEGEEDIIRSLPASCSRTAAGWNRTLFLMPGCAFDPDRRRIGYGGGFYDRFLAGGERKRREERFPEEFCMIAPAFSCQLLDRLPEEETDIRPDLLLTEHGFI